MYTLILLLYSLTFSVHADQGPTVDPNGGQVTIYSDEGPGLCPHGGHMASAQSDVGSAIDPNG
jgi:hypothetical protein